MKRITNVKGQRSGGRAYASALRDDQTEATRQRILEGLVRTMARGVAGLSVPAVAREAGVSVPTVYRHFSTKADLVAALAPYLTSKTGLMEIPDMEKQSLGATARELYRRSEAVDMETRAAMASQLGNEVRLRTMPQRLANIRRTIAARVPGLSAEELARFTRLALILLSSATMRAYKDYLGAGAKDAAEDIAWAFDTLEGTLRRGRR